MTDIRNDTAIGMDYNYFYSHEWTDYELYHLAKGIEVAELEVEFNPQYPADFQWNAYVYAPRWFMANSSATDATWLRAIAYALIGAVLNHNPSEFPYDKETPTT